jgi:hypothetical protein
VLQQLVVQSWIVGPGRRVRADTGVSGRSCDLLLI